MVSPLKEKTAILIPLFGRKEFTERLLKYLDEKKCIYPIYLSDGSKKTQFTRTYLKNYYKFLKIIYLRFPHDKNYILSTKEWDNGAKVWNHTISLRALGDGKINYEDSIIIYAGLMTDFVASFAKLFYKHRQKRWQIIAANNLNFGM